MKKLLSLLLLTGVFIVSCSQGGKERQEQLKNSTSAQPQEYDPQRGEGKFDQVDIGKKLDPAMAKDGKTIADLKCASCHKYTDERLVGPGWAGVSKKHKPEWLMNFITNPDPMIDKDPELQAQLELCLVRMPNQNLTDDEARQILEFMRQNDGVQ